VFGPGHLLGGYPVVAKVLTTAVATVFAWIGNRYWTFSAQKTDTPAREFGFFVLINVGGIIINAGVLYAALHVFGLSGPVAYNVFGNLLGWGLASLFRYLCYKFLVFSGPVSAPGPKFAQDGQVELEDLAPGPGGGVEDDPADER